MVMIVDLKTEIGKLNLLRGRTPQMTEAERKPSGAFATFAPYRDGNIYGARFSGNGAWERHPNGDELVQIVDGDVIMHFIGDDGPQQQALTAGMIVVVPQGTWHRFESAEGVTIMTATPAPTDHLTIDIDDPRKLSDAEVKGGSEQKWR